MVSVKGIMELYGNTHYWPQPQEILRNRNGETVLPEVLHSIRSLLCTATNATPHERLFSYQRRTHSGHSLPTWLSMPGPVLLRCHVRASKYKLLVDKVVLLEANPQYALIRFSNGCESTVSVSDLAPARNSLQSGDVVDDNIQKDLNDSTPTNENPKEKEVDSNDSQTIDTPKIVPSPSDPNITPPHVMSWIPDIPRRSQREIRKPKRYEELWKKRGGGGECTILICPWHCYCCYLPY